MIEGQAFGVPVGACRLPAARSLAGFAAGRRPAEAGETPAVPMFVTERDTSGPLDLSQADVDAINAAGRGEAGVMFPPREDKKPLLYALPDKDGKYTVQAGNVVGFVALPSGRTLHVQSKLGSNVGVFWLLLHALKFDVSILKRWPELPGERNVLSAVLLLLREEARKLIHSGLRKDYLPVEETLGEVRGRILPARTIAETRGLAHRVTCLYDDYTAHVFDNQVLRQALRAGAAHSPGLRAALLGTDALFEGEVSYEPASRSLAADRLKRLMDARHPSRRAYIAAHSLSYIVLRLLSYSDFGSSSRQPGVLLNMEKLFEMALRNMLEQEFGRDGSTPREIKFGATDPAVAKGLKPDISLHGLLVDAKYKEKPLFPRSNEMGLQPPDGDVFQAHTYSYFGNRPCALVYALGNHTPQRELLTGGLDQASDALWPRVGLFGLNLAGIDIDTLEFARQQLVERLDRFRRCNLSQV